MSTRRTTRQRPAEEGAQPPYHSARSVDDLTERNVRTIIDLERAARSKQTASQRWAQRVSAFCGSMPFVWIHVAAFAAWIGFNALPGLPHVDPFPFTFLTLIVSLETIFLSTFILISQNEETRATERRNALDLQINLLTEQENTQMLRMLEQIAKKVGVSFDDDPAISVLEQATRPETLAAQIDRVEVEDPESPGLGGAGR
jgi:uncharacterized membrane protein